MPYSFHESSTTLFFIRNVATERSTAFQMLIVRFFSSTFASSRSFAFAFLITISFLLFSLLSCAHHIFQRAKFQFLHVSSCWFHFEREVSVFSFLYVMLRFTPDWHFFLMNKNAELITQEFVHCWGICVCLLKAVSF